MTTSANSVEQVRKTIRDLERRRYAAMTAADARALADLLDDRLTYAHSDASYDTKQSYLHKIAAGSLAYRTIRHPEHELIVADGMALVVGEMHAEVVVTGTSKTLRNASLAVWLGSGEDWRLLAYQPTQLPAQ